MAEFEIIFSLGGDNESGVILANITPDSLSPSRGKELEFSRFGI